MFTKTRKEAPADSDSKNARFLAQAGFVQQLAAGVYSFLPLGLRTLRKIEAIVREEMDATGAQEITMPLLHPKALYDATGRWEKIDVLFKTEGSGSKEYALSSTAEEVITPLVQSFANSYKDFPVAVYQMRDKFRNEPRAKSGILRGREFLMKDLYSFHLTEEDFLAYYERMKEAYLNVYKRCGLDAIVAAASGGVFTEKHSHEFQVATEAGEDHIYIDRETGEAFNKEVIEEADHANEEKYEIKKAIEVGNIFPLECRFSHAFDFTVNSAEGKNIDVIMGCYGIGISRLMGSIVEVLADDDGMVWPKEVAPYHVHLVALGEDEMAQAESLYADLQDAGLEVLFDDRADASPGAKLKDADLIGCPVRILVSKKSLEAGGVEWKDRSSGESGIWDLGEAVERAAQMLVEENV